MIRVRIKNSYVCVNNRRGMYIMESVYTVKYTVTSVKVYKRKRVLPYIVPLIISNESVGFDCKQFNNSLCWLLYCVSHKVTLLSDL